jgi:lipid II:glycine glycyltransferase (peptidoglycan interpeptide bridge formation enzyme)
VSFKENMPQTTIMINLKKSDQELLKEMNNGCADRVKKAIKKGVLVRE